MTLATVTGSSSTTYETLLSSLYDDLGTITVADYTDIILFRKTSSEIQSLPLVAWVQDSWLRFGSAIYIASSTTRTQQITIGSANTFYISDITNSNLIDNSSSTTENITLSIIGRK